MKDALKHKRVVVAGGTGNVGSFIVRGLLGQGATVVVPSRNDTKVRELRDDLVRDLDVSPLARLHHLRSSEGRL